MNPNAVAVFDAGVFVGCYWPYDGGFNAFRRFSEPDRRQRTMKYCVSVDEALEFIREVEI